MCCQAWPEAAELSVLLGRTNELTARVPMWRTVCAVRGSGGGRTEESSVRGAVVPAAHIFNALLWTLMLPRDLPTLLRQRALRSGDRHSAAAGRIRV